MPLIRFCPGTFLSTLSLRRATVDALELANLVLFLSTLSLRRATWLRCWQLAARDISIHALLAESDADKHAQPPKRQISIHALLAESDLPVSAFTDYAAYFYPRSPCGERRRPRALKSRRCVFLSTLSLRRATNKPTQHAG